MTKPEKVILELVETLQSLMVTYADYRVTTDPSFNPAINSRQLDACRSALAIAAKELARLRGLK